MKVRRDLKGIIPCMLDALQNAKVEMTTSELKEVLRGIYSIELSTKDVWYILEQVANEGGRMTKKNYRPTINGKNRLQYNYVGKMWGKNKQNRHPTTVEWRLMWSFKSWDLPPAALHPWPPRAIIDQSKNGLQLRWGLVFSHCTAPYESELSTVRHSTKKALNIVERFCFGRDSVGIRTQDPQLRRLLLYPTELPNRSVFAFDL